MANSISSGAIDLKHIFFGKNCRMSPFIFTKPGSIANVQIEIQIVDTHEPLENLINIGFAYFSRWQFSKKLRTCGTTHS